MADVNKVAQLQEALLSSFETYYKEASKNNQYDVTVDATIVDVSQKPDGIYRVRTTGAEFEAYATAGSYYKNDIVLVQIPNGDYKNPKFILGRKSDAEANQLFSFKLPFDDFIGLRYLNEGKSFSGQYWANYPTYTDNLTKENIERSQLLNTKIWSWANTGGSTIGNTRLGIEADWKTLLGQYQPLQGNYGFRIIVKGVTSSTKANASTQIEREYYFTNNDMYGNPYAFSTFFTHQKIIDISEFMNVHNIDIYFYQDFNFRDAANNLIYYTVEEVQIAENKKVIQPSIPENIAFDNVNIYLGVSAEDTKDESTFLYSYDNLSYTGKEILNQNDTGDSWENIITYVCDEELDLHFSWVHYESNGTYSVIDNFEKLVQQREKGLTDEQIRNGVTKKVHIFWYRYLYKDDITAEEDTWSANHSDLKKDWEDSLESETYETKMERYGGSNWRLIPAWTDTFSQTFTPRGDKSKEKFKVVVQHDGTHTTSKELIFSNTRDIEAEIEAGATNDAVVIKCFRLKKVRDAKNEWTGQYEAIEDNSINAFYIYDENNKILYNDDNERFDEHEYYIQIQVRNDDSNQYEILQSFIENDEISQTNRSTNTQVSWSLPRSHDYSMLKDFARVSTVDAGYFDIDSNIDSVEYKNFYEATLKFSVNSIYNNRYLNNTVGAIITRDNESHHIEREFMFGRAEGLGHDFLPVIEIVDPVGGTYLHTGTEFQIACAVYNKDGSLFETPSTLTFTWRELSGKSTFQHYDENEEPQDGYQIGKYTGTNATYLKKYKSYRGNVIKGQLIPSEDGIIYPPIFEVTVNGAASYPLIVRKGFLICNNYEYKQHRDIIVPSRIEFKSDGANPIFFNDYFEVAKLTGGVQGSHAATYDIEYPEWKIYNKNNLLHLETKTKERNSNNIQYKLVFNTDGAPQWGENLLTPAYYTYLYYNSEDYYVAQAIAFDRNYYASSLVNSWDGTTLTWNEEDGAILSTMIAAGTKEGNKFTGVMMGDWHSKGDESLDVPGLYGYNKGAQTFGFKTDGTGFIGGSGKGRIEFDGNEAVISNSDRSCYINLNPVPLGFSETDLRSQGFSQNFIYCKVKKATDPVSAALGNIVGEESWAKDYLDDNANDYFVVDPNHGVVTTGGVIARYGAIGNWMISNEGLYQKDTVNNKYMYLGFNQADKETYRNQLNDALNDFNTAKDTALNNKTTAMALALDEYNRHKEDYEINYKDLTLDDDDDVATDVIEKLEQYSINHYYNIAQGLWKTYAFLLECVNTANTAQDKNAALKTAFETNYQSAKFAASSSSSWHYHYDENGNKAEQQCQTGWDLTMSEICEKGNAADAQYTVSTYYGLDISIPRVLNIFTIEHFNNIINACENGYKKFKAARNRQVLQALGDYLIRERRIYDYKVSLIEEEYGTAIAAAEEAYNEDVAEINAQHFNGNDGERYCIYAGENEWQNPYFSVKWDGTLYARRGQIANTWDIDDTSLTYKKNNDTIYIGQGDKNTRVILPSIEKIIYFGKTIYYTNFNRTGTNKDNEIFIYNTDGTQKYYKNIDALKTDKNLTSNNLIHANRWAMSAGGATNINFGVTVNGELYSQLGTIGGWRIHENTLSSTVGNMIFDAGNGRILIGAPIPTSNGAAYPITIDSNGLMSIVGTNGETTTTGFLYLGNISIEALSVGDSWQVPTGISYSKDGDTRTITVNDIKVDYDNSNSNWGNGNSGSITGTTTIGTLTYYPEKATTNKLTLTSSNTFNIVTRTPTQNYGVAIAMGETEKNQRITAIYPINNTENYSSLGMAIPASGGSTTDYRWNVYANILDAVSINTTGSLSALNIYMNKEKVATQPWVYDELKAIWDTLNSASSGVSSNAGSISGLGVSLAEQAIVSVVGEAYQYDDGMTKFHFKNIEGNDVVDATSATTTVFAANMNHHHKILEFEIENSELILNIGRVAQSADDHEKKVPLRHDHSVEGVIDKNGRLTLTWGDANFSKATGEESESIIDLSAWLISRVHAIFSSSVSVSSIITAEDGDESGVAYSKGTATLNYGGKQSHIEQENNSTDYWNCEAKHGGVSIIAGDDVYLNGTYTRYSINGVTYYR